MAYDQQKKIEKAIKAKQTRIDKAISNKEKSIAYFNSVNAAIELLKDAGLELSKEGVGFGDEQFKEEIIKWRDWFYSEWQNWYLNSIPQPPTPYIPPTTSQALQEKADEVLNEEKLKEDEIEEANRELEEIESPKDEPQHYQE